MGVLPLERVAMFTARDRRIIDRHQLLVHYSATFPLVMIGRSADMK
jgi:hypothetical protein